MNGGCCVTRLWQVLRSLVRLGMGLWLCLNVSLATIPRCDTILAVFQHSLLDQHSLQAMPQGHCEHHKAKQQAQTSGPTWTDDQLCECSVLKYMTAHLQSAVLDPVVTHTPHPLAVGGSSYDLQESEAEITPDSPPPRFV
jgi:hypothetical protein